MSATQRYDLVLRSTRVALPDGMRAAAVCVTSGRVAAVLPRDAPVLADEQRDLGDLALLPGLVDTHVHVNEPGRTHWEGFDSATRAAARGGVTTVVDMPLNSVPPTVTRSALALKRAAAAGRCHVDVGFWGGAIPEVSDLPGLHADGVFGFKCFLADSGVPEFPPVSPAELVEVARKAAALDAVLLVHAESAGVLDGRAHLAPEGRSYAAFLASRPDEAEREAVDSAVKAAELTGARVHVLHVSSASVLPRIRAAKRAGARVTAETCPHYLFFAAEDIADGATEFKCCPPIRSKDNRELLWEALEDGVIDLVVSDHSPSDPALKHRATGDFAAAWGGISSLQLSLPAVWTMARERGWSLDGIATVMSRRSADFAGLAGKGRIDVGADADLVVFDPEQQWRVSCTELAHRHPVTPYEGRTLTGAVVDTYLRGERVTGDEARGRLLRRDSSSPCSSAIPSSARARPDGSSAVAGTTEPETSHHLVVSPAGKAY